MVRGSVVQAAGSVSGLDQIWPDNSARYDLVMAHMVAVLAVPGMAPFEMSVALEVFGLARPELGDAWDYEVRVCTEADTELPGVGGIRLSTQYRLDSIEQADTVILPAAEDVARDPSPHVVAAIRGAAANGARIVSICSGAFVLAATGLLDGRRATTHWRYAELLAARFPQIRVDADVIYTDEGQVLTGAGTAAAIDLCLHLVRRDLGAEAANSVARRMVVAPHRAGGQAQFIERPVAQTLGEDPIERVMQHLLDRLGQSVSVAEMARVAHLAPRSLTRRFTARTGTSPARWLLEQRLLAALPLLERTDLPVELVGQTVGFATPAAFRRHFRRARGISPSAHRRAFAIGP